MSATLDFWITFYFVCGLATWIFLAINYEFLDGTPWWRRVLSGVFCIALWPVILITLMFVG